MRTGSSIFFATGVLLNVAPWLCCETVDRRVLDLARYCSALLVR
jgi:hypothetical protein